jgi:dihydropyrimidinase/dihydroorotase
MADYVIKNGTVVTPSGKILGGVAVEGEKISYVGGESGLPQAKKVIDAKGNFIIPGFVEVHCHMGICPAHLDFDESWQIQWKTESEAAAYGGITTIRTCLTLKDPYLPVIDKYINWASENSYLDIGIYPTVCSEEHIDELIPMAERGMPSWKCFYDAYQGEEGRQVGLAHTDSGMLYKAFEKLGEFGYPGLVMLHAEEYALYTMLQDRIIKAGRKDLKAWSDSRPNICESMKIHASSGICEEVGGAPLYIVHMSTKEGVDICQEYQRRGVQVIPETLPCFLVNTKHDGEKIGVWGKINPPFREKEDIKRMWEGLRTDVVKCMGTDNCAYIQEDKEAGLGQFGDVWKALPGLSGGNQHWLPIMMTEGFNKGNLTIEKMVEICCENNAKTFGLYPRKGVLAEGSDADIVIVDPDKEMKVDENYYKGLNKTFSHIWGMQLKGLPVMTMVRGQVVMEDWKTVGKSGHGEFIPSKKY